MSSATENGLQQMEAALAQSRANLRALFDNLTIAIFSVDLDGRFLIFNPYTEQFFREQYGVSLLEGMSMLDILKSGKGPHVNAESRVAFWTDAFGKAFRGEQVIGDRRFNLPDGPLEVRFTISPLYDDKRIIGASVIGQNITEEKRLHAQKQAVAQAEIEGVERLMGSLI